MSYLMNDQIRQINTALSDFIEESLNPAHLKDIRTEQYIQVSPGFAKGLGLESKDEVVSLTVDDLVTQEKIWGGKNFSQAFIHWRDKQPEIVRNFEQQVRQTKRRVHQETLFFSPEGHILIYDTIKVPLFEQKNEIEEVIAIYTYSREASFRRSLNHLFNVYLEYYPQEQAIQRLLMYLEIDGYFEVLPDSEEIKTLFSIHQDSRISNAIAQSTHFLSLLNKVRKDNWQEMLVRLYAIPTI